MKRDASLNDQSSNSRETFERRENALTPESRDERLFAACSYLETLDLPPVNYQEEDSLVAFLDEFKLATTIDERERYWKTARRYLRRIDGKVADTELFDFYARREFDQLWNQKSDAERRTLIVSCIGDESSLREAPVLRNYAFNLAAATTSGANLEKKKEALVDAFIFNRDSAFALIEYTTALDDYGFSDAEEIEVYCDELTDFMRVAIMRGGFGAQAADSPDASVVESAQVDAQTASCEARQACEAREEPVACEPESAEAGEPEAGETEAGADEAGDALTKVDGYYEIDEDLARRAQEANSFREYEPMTATREYRKAVDTARSVAARQKEKVGAEYWERIDVVLDSYEKRLAQWYDKFHRNSASCPSILVVGAANFPQKKHEIKTRRVGELLKEHQKIAELLLTIQGVGLGGIRADDENAIQKLEQKLALLKEIHEQMKEANAYRRQNGSWDGYEGPLKDQIDPSVPEIYQYFNLPNSSAEIRRITKRIEALKKRAQTDFGSDVPFDGGVVRFDKAENRLQILFDAVPDVEARNKMKKRAFKWSPKNKAWQRMITPDAIYAAKDLGYLPPDWKLQDAADSESDVSESDESDS